MELLVFVVAMTAIVLGCGVGIAWAAVWYGINKKPSLTDSTSPEKLESMRRDIDALTEDVRGVQEALADVTLLVEDTTRGRLGPSDDTK